MKRGLVFSLCALALVAGAAAAQAQTNNVDLSLNLRYNDPADPSEGGRWFLMAQSDAAFGIAGISAYISNIDLAGIDLGNDTAVGGYSTVTAAAIGGNVVKQDGSPFATAVTGGVNLVYGQDLATIVSNVGKGAGTPGNIATDPLRNSAWNNSALIASGTFSTGNRPAFITVGANSTDANVFASATPGQAAVDATVTTTVRGDSRVDKGLNNPANAGLLFGDLNRNGVVSFNGDALPAFNNIGQFAGSATWDQGDFNDSGTISFNGDALPAFNNIGVAAPPAPQVGAVPEPATIALCGLALVGMLSVARRK